MGEINEHFKPVSKKQKQDMNPDKPKLSCDRICREDYNVLMSNVENNVLCKLHVLKKTYFKEI